MQELCDGRITTIEDATAKLQQTIQKWQSFSDMDIESESESDRKSDSGGDIIGHIDPADAICITDATSTEQADTSDFIGNNTLDLGREGRGSLIQQESCSANIQPQSEANRPNPLGEGNEHVDANPSFSPGLVQHYRDQEGLHNNTVPKRLNGEDAREETTPKGVASAAVGGNDPTGDEGLHDDTIPKNLNEETPSEENTPTAAASTVGETPENEPPGDDAGSDTGLKLTQNVPQTPQIPENCCAECTARQEAERRNGECYCNGMQQLSTNTKRDFKKYIEDGNKKLENRNRKALRGNLCYLICYLQPVIDDVALYMFSHLVLSDRQREKIASKTTETEKCEHLVTKVLLHSSEKAFWVFMQALEDNNCEFIVDQLLGKANVTGHIRATVDILEERRTSEDDQRCLQVVLRAIDEYISNNPDISRPMTDAIRNALEEQNLIVTDLSRGSILMNLTFYTVEQLDAFWMWVKSWQPSPLSMSLTEVILTEEIRNMVQEDLILSLSTDMDLEEYLKKRRRLLHGDLPMTSDDSNFGKRPLKECNQSLLWLDIAGQPKMEANPKVLLEWAYESGYNDPLPLLTEKFPQTFTGYNEKDFRIERLHKLIIYQNGRISQMNEKCEELENNLLQTATDLKKAQDTLEEKNQFIKILTDKLRQITMSESNGELLKWQYPSNAQTNINSIVGIGTQSIETHPKPAVPVPKSEGSVVQVRTQKTNSDDLKQPNDSGLQASGGHAEEHFDNGDFPEERMYGERVCGLSTVICVDTSGSMEGEAFTDMKSAIHKILDDAEYTNNVYDFKELIGLVECGSGSDGRTVVSLTDNYDRIRRALEHFGFFKV
ncbi:uncharacterized protein LOC106161705 [Lingula anatina]|uniref:Uncharacterized protein LOC106161705 n=1 Tax=Lingula anatina TaxID=7574 RepID=A0A2R2MTA6_LINAN|nr:uncharacterized protein LOC106161705 [Lingula anatina]|eukprot:XP_023933343.1 uncharacterized protein LOC106161705 [Lingula anatina]